MCGRYVGRGDKQRIADAMRAEAPFEIFPSYNVAPATFQPVVTQNEEGNREAGMMWWRLIPFWAKDKKDGQHDQCDARRWQTAIPTIRLARTAASRYMREPALAISISRLLHLRVLKKTVSVKTLEERLYMRPLPASSR
jgi:hypothetical protein